MCASAFVTALLTKGKMSVGKPKVYKAVLLSGNLTGRLFVFRFSPKGSQLAEPMVASLDFQSFSFIPAAPGLSSEERMVNSEGRETTVTPKSSRNLQRVTAQCARHSLALKKNFSYSNFPEINRSLAALHSCWCIHLLRAFFFVLVSHAATDNQTHSTSARCTSGSLSGVAGLFISRDV